MTSAQISKIVDKIGVSADTWVNIPNLYQIYLSTDANVFNGVDWPETKHENSMYYFDTQSNLLKIKRYSAKKCISSRFLKRLKFTNSSVEVPLDGNGKMSYPGLAFKGIKIKEPEVGDIIFTVNSDLEFLEQTTVKEIVYLENSCLINFTSEIDTSNITCWAKKDEFPSSRMEQYDNTILFTTTPKTDAPFDSIIDFYYIAGISLKRGIPDDQIRSI